MNNLAVDAPAAAGVSTGSEGEDVGGGERTWGRRRGNRQQDGEHCSASFSARPGCALKGGDSALDELQHVLPARRFGIRRLQRADKPPGGLLGRARVDRCQGVDPSLRVAHHTFLSDTRLKYST